MYTFSYLRAALHGSIFGRLHPQSLAAVLEIQRVRASGAGQFRAVPGALCALRDGPLRRVRPAIYASQTFAHARREGLGCLAAVALRREPVGEIAMRASEAVMLGKGVGVQRLAPR